MTDRKLVTIRTVDQVWKHPGADRLDLLQVGGWQLVSGIGNFQPGDFCVFHEIDSFLPISHPAYADLASSAVKWTDLTGVEREGHRLKTMKLRKEWSQGYALRLDLFPEIVSRGFAGGKTLFESLSDDGLLFDHDFSELLGVLKWEKAIPMGGAAKGNFPSHIPKTDQERIQNLFGKFGNRGEARFSEYTNAAGEIVKVEKYFEYCRDDLWEITVKLDGSSMTVFRHDDDFGVCSRNNELVEAPGNAFWFVAQRLNLRERLNTLGLNIALQGELCGPGIQGNTDKLQKLDFYVFDIVDIATRKKLSHPKRFDILNQLNEMPGDKIQHTPQACAARKFDFQTVKEVLDFAEGPSLNPQVKREGLVFKSVQDPEVSFKVISNSYLVKHDA